MLEEKNEGAGNVQRSHTHFIKRQESMPLENARELSLCQYGNVSCVRCCLPHIGGDACGWSPGEPVGGMVRNHDYQSTHGSDMYRGPGNILMKFRMRDPKREPKLEASQYEDAFPDVGREEMERRFSQRRRLFLSLYDRKRPRESLRRYMKAAQELENYKYRHAVSAGLQSLFMGGWIPRASVHSGELPECHLLAFVDDKGRVGCLAHPLAETSGGFDGRDEVGFFHHTGCCRNVGCEASREFKRLSVSALKVFDGAVPAMSWYEYSRHSTAVLVFYLRSYDYLLNELDRAGVIDSLSLEKLVEHTNRFYDAWPLREFGENSLGDPLPGAPSGGPSSEMLLYAALGTRFFKGDLNGQLGLARDYVNRFVASIR